MVRKYPKTTGYYVYVHITPNKMCYFGMSQMQPNQRWYPSLYKKNTSLQFYIQQYGWDSIEHMVIQDGLTKHQAEILEDWFIGKAIKDDFCINERRSGGFSRDNPKEYNRVFNQRTEIKQHKREHNNEYMREYRQRPEVKQRRREFLNEYNQRPEVKEHKREYQRNYEKRSERKEYRHQYYLKKKSQTIKEQ